MLIKEKLIRFACSFLPLKNRIIFESNPEFSCNTLPVYEEMVRRNIRDKYEIYWLVEDKNAYSEDKSGNKYINYSEKGIKRIFKEYIIATSRVLIFSNRMLRKRKSNQISFYLMHGSPLKKTPGYYNDTCDYVITEAEIFNLVVSSGLKVPLNRMVPLGFPRNDVFNNSYESCLKLGIPNNRKLIVWMPTFRKNKNSGFSYGEITKLGVPLINSVLQFKKINSVLQKENIHLLIKLHPAEDLRNIKINNYSNILFVSDKELNMCGLTSYKILADSDALLTDYSSVYYDYLLLNKPIGLVIDNLEEISSKIGFYYGDYKSFVKGVYIENLDSFYDFIKEIGEGIDSDINNRNWARDRYCQYCDYESTRRVVDFIINEIE